VTERTGWRNWWRRLAVSAAIVASMCAAGWTWLHSDDARIILRAKTVRRGQTETEVLKIMGPHDAQIFVPVGSGITVENAYGARQKLRANISNLVWKHTNQCWLDIKWSDWPVVIGFDGTGRAYSIRRGAMVKSRAPQFVEVEQPAK